jgi:hypothetical protein
MDGGAGSYIKRGRMKLRPIERPAKGKAHEPMAIARGEADCCDWLLTEGSEQRQLPRSFGVNRFHGVVVARL